MGTLGNRSPSLSQKPEHPKAAGEKVQRTQEARLQAHGHYLPGQETDLVNPWPGLILEGDWCGPWGAQIVDETSFLGGL